MCNTTGFFYRTHPTALAAIFAFFCSAAATAQDEQPGGVLDEVIVTAQKRAQASKDIPMSISVLSGDRLVREQADNFQDLVPLVPSLSIDTSQPGFSRITLRGINTGGVSSTVGVYVDEVPFGSSTGLANGAVLSGDFDTFDMARVEVLRGPQGTLYGASSLGGVLKYVPNAPSTDRFEVKAQATVEDVKGGDTGFAITGMVNIPLGDRFALRASAFSRTDEGFIDSIGNNPVPTLTDPAVNVIEGTRVEAGLNKTETVGGRLAALFQPSDNFSLTLMAMTQDIDSAAPNDVDGDPVTLEPLNSSPVQSRYQRSYANVEYELFSASLDWDIGALRLQSITSDNSLEQDWQQDAAIASSLAGVPLSAFLTFLFDDPGTPEIAPLLSAVLPQVTGTDKFTQEFRLLSDDNDTFEWLVGVYYTDEESVLDQVILAVDAGTETPAAGFPDLATARVDSTYEELAFFANATWHVSPQFELSFGARASDNDQEIRQTTSGPLAGDSDIEGGSSESPFTWSFSPRFELNDTSSIYAQVATGFRAGGPNVVPPTAPEGFPATFDSDTLTNYEIGYKAITGNGKISVDVSAYYLDWEDIQLLGNFEGFGANTNGGTAVSKGLELTADVAPMEGLSIAFNASYTDAYLTEDVPDLAATDGDPLPYVPEWAFGLSGDYEWALRGDSTAYLGGSVSYTGERPAGLDNADPNGNFRELDSYTLLGLRAGLQFESWYVELYGKNLTDEIGITSLGTVDEAVTGRVEMGILRPRTYGLMVGVSF